MQKERYEKEKALAIKKSFALKEIKNENKLDKYKSEEMRKLSAYGIGGCALFLLSKEELEKMFKFAKGEINYCEDIDKLLRKALPRAYPEISKGKNCRDYFLGEHNERVHREYERDFCLAKIGEVKKIFPREKGINFRNVPLLKSPIGEKFQIVGIISFGDKFEYAFLDFLKDVKEGDKVIIHRGIACEILK
jgi:hypothetical protein